ncbi:MFS transporter [Mesobacillus subterraneus]|uniref:MFS transporter n=1 Tax=Mesobacillus subterraneus TaxID=285983 RepID=A0A427TYQ0_9BACI|nr:MFS transporter [Mesobacillus subterraneus]RSD29245.1 MFS transporter [Mesobacillus subterraneus]
MKKFAGIFQNRSFTKLFLANFTSQMGSTIGLTAFMFYLLDRFSSQPVYATITELMYSLPMLAVFFLIGVLADRVDRQKITVYCDWIGAGLSLMLIGAIYIGWMPFVFAVLFLRSGVQKFFFPAEHGMIQGILKKEDYTTAAGLNQLVMSLFMLFGNGLGVLAYWTAGIYGAILVDTISFIISALLIQTTVVSEEARLPNGPHKLNELNLRMVFRDFKKGFSYVLSNKLLFTLIIGFFVFGIVNGGFSVMPIFILKYKLAPESYEQYSIVVGFVFGIGVLLGSFIASMLAQKVKLYYMISVGLIIAGSFTALASIPDDIYLFLGVLFISALALPLVNIGIGGWFPRIIDPKMMGRVQGLISPLNMVSHSLTLTFIAYSFPASLTIEMLYWVVGGCLAIVGIFYMIVLPKLAEEKASLVEENAAEQGV